MGYSITARDNKGEEISYFHYNDVSKQDERYLHKVLGVGYIVDNNLLVRPYSKGAILDAKSKMVKITGTLPEQDFLENCLVYIREIGNNITITFN